VAVVAGSAVREGEMTAVSVNGRKLILTRWEGRLYAVNSECPHAAADLSRGSLHRWKITCPEHEYCFDIRDGRLTWPEDEYYRLRVYQVKQEEGVVMVKIVNGKQ
jgi:nitrite reductase/ring-hydroxylating ferredoxin subunit